MKEIAICLGLLALPVSLWAQQTGQSDNASSVPIEARNAKLNSVIGKLVYACSSTELYELPTSGSESKPATGGEKAEKPRAQEHQWRRANRLAAFPLLQGFSVLQADVVGQIEGVETIGITLRLPDGKAAGAIGHVQTNGPVLEGDELLKELTVNSNNYLLVEIPERFSKSGIESIKYHAITKGMSTSEVVCARGYPETQNNYGDAGEQWVYNHGRLLIYFDAETRVVSDIQELGEP
jgi:hypothetical protein